MPQSSVRKKLFLAIFGPSLGVLLVFGITGLWLDVINLRSSLESDARATAQMLARTLRSPVATADDTAIAEVLSSLEGDPDISFGVIYSAENKVTSFHTRPGVDHFPAAPDEEREDGTLLVLEPIRMGEKRIGSLLLGVSLRRYQARLRWYVAGALAGVAVLSAVAALVASVLQRRMSEPLRVLADTAESISQKQDYSVRAPELKDREFQALTGAFNHMLTEIQEQTSALTTANAHLKHTNAELEAFTYSVSHDLRTPLRAIAGYSQVLLSMEPGEIPAEAAEYLKRIESNAIRMAELIDDLLAFSRVDARPLARQELELKPMVQEICDELRAQNPGREIEFTVDELGRAAGDPSLLRQVFANLLHNAVKYSRERRPARIHVGVTKTEAGRTWFVEDNGAGFEMQYASKLFGLFQRLHSQKDFEGTGIGLAIVQRIVARHGGKVWATGEPGKGASFFLTLS